MFFVVVGMTINAIGHVLQGGPYDMFVGRDSLHFVVLVVAVLLIVAVVVFIVCISSNSSSSIRAGSDINPQISSATNAACTSNSNVRNLVSC